MAALAAFFEYRLAVGSGNRDSFRRIHAKDHLAIVQYR